MTITHEMELTALAGRQVVHLVDPQGEPIAYGILERHSSWEGFWRVVWDACLRPTVFIFELSDVADIAGTVIELRGAR